jgi:predicted DNA-binding protein (UPF0278 family)
MTLVLMPASAQEQTSLRGLDTLRVEILGAILPVTRSTLQADVELRLRQTGVRIDPNAASSLQLLITVYRPPDLPSNYVYNFVFRLRERITTGRGTSADAVTWESHSTVGLGVKGDAELFRRDVQEPLEEFITAYRAANPRP